MSRQEGRQPKKWAVAAARSAAAARDPSPPLPFERRGEERRGEVLELLRSSSLSHIF